NVIVFFVAQIPNLSVRCFDSSISLCCYCIISAPPHGYINDHGDHFEHLVPLFFFAFIEQFDLAAFFEPNFIFFHKRNEKILKISFRFDLSDEIFSDLSLFLARNCHRL
ncbi:hypothetical protein SSS_02627, partial [Sarcoptes scabiei]